MKPGNSNRDPALPLEADGSFAVKDSIFINGIIAAICYAVFGYGVYLAFFSAEKNGGVLDFFLLLTIVPAIIFTKRAREQRIYIRIDHNGIFTHNRLLTNWASFHSASYAQKETLASVQDNFVLVVRYHTASGLYTAKVPLANTQDKSEEQVVAAINHFYRIYQQGGGRSAV